ncbi:hypothetical protein BDV40DRAFT_203634 [Aspergillus tamarii]|uniref:Autophagy-related protein 29 n=1 Tax=Aspergillus tamarii TaxID=41984 RepID=A0A5N6UQT1_ASPTM|nr:hypothetical protein BDV40DRAFT_203634 [Aspergillus tamarii]
MTSLNQSGDTNFTVLIRLPFPRGDFVDPPPTEWNAAKDQALWDLLSRPSKGDDIDCIAERFDVTLQFLLQQAAWLYDRQLSQVRWQMRKVGTTQSSSPSPAPGSVSGSTALGGQSAKGGPGTAPRVQSRLSSHQKETLPQRGPPPRRTSSATTVNQIKISRESPRTETPVELKDPRWESLNRRSSASKRDQAPVPSAPIHKSPILQEEDLSSSSASLSSSDEDDGLASRRGLRFRRFGKFSTHRPGLRDDEEDEDESPAFLPLSRAQPEAARDPSAQDLNATLRLQGEDHAGARRRTSEQSPIPRASITTESSTSSASSGAPVTVPRRGVNSIPSPLSSSRKGELAHLSPRRLNTSGRDTSDGTPSMGSSYSDLDGEYLLSLSFLAPLWLTSTLVDASVTQSALEEALLSNMQHGGMASRMSTISQALRSRYL